jgi:hypothetical protein
MQKLKRAVSSLCGFGIVLSGVQAAHALDVMCPEDLEATWSGAAFGQVTSFNRNMTRFRVLDVPTDFLACAQFAPPADDHITVVVQLSPGSIPALCGGRARVSGLAPTFGGVPPFGGFPFESGRIDAVPTYDEATGRCQLDLPLTGLVVSVEVTQECTPIFENVWDCPGSTTPVSALFEQRAERLAGLQRIRAPEIFQALSQYGAFAGTPAPIATAPLPQSTSHGATLAEL